MGQSSHYFFFFLLSRKVSYPVSLTYAINSFIAFLVGSIYDVIDFMGVTLGNVIGVIGGFVLLLLSLIQYTFERKKYIIDSSQ